MSLSRAIKTEARRMGFHLVGITTPDPPPHIAAFEQWLAVGLHGEMTYLASERSRQCRADPRQILRECQSILIVGMRYPNSNIRLDAFHGQIASYAWQEDYHQVLPDRLKTLAAFIEAQTGDSFHYMIYTDTGPILERDLAQRAGLGWIGKNTCLIHPKMGSYFLLAEILLDLKLEADPPFVFDRCGSCTRCITACPTSCILPNRTLEARRCISYLTIENKAPIPKELRSKVGNWVFGCDVCQQVCPWNRFADETAPPVFKPRPEMIAPNLIQELHLTVPEFNRKFKDNPIVRARRRGYLRNIAVALGNSRDQAAIPALSQTLGEVEPLARGHAAWALGQMESEAARQALHNALGIEVDAWVINEIQSALGH